jgi:hypothetical protein
MHPLQCRPAASWVPYTTSCNTQSSAPEDGRNHCPKHVELIGIINKSVIVASSWLYYLCCNMYIPSLFMIISQFLACYLFDHVFLKLLLHSSRNSRPLKVKALFLTSETSETDYPYHVISQKNGVLNCTIVKTSRPACVNIAVCLFNSTISQTRIKMSFAKIFIAVSFLRRLDTLHTCIY